MTARALRLPLGARGHEQMRKDPQMTRTSFARRAMLAATALVTALAIAAFAVSALAAETTSAPRAATGTVGHVRGTSAVLQGSVNPNGLETTYFFQYGPTVAYGHQTPVTSVGKGTTTVKVGQTVVGFIPGYHYRIVATNSKGTKPGRDRTYSTTSGRLKFAIEKSKQVAPTPYGGTFVLRGTLTGGPLHSIAAQSSPFPYLTAFTDVGTPLLTNAAGSFAIPIPNLKVSTQLRVRTSDARPLFSPVVSARVAVRVTLKVRSSAHKGLYRLYGTVTPAKVGATVLLQVERAVRPRAKSEEESETRFATQERTIVKRATRTFSRFSKVLTVRKGGHYRAYVVLRTGPLVSGASPSVTLHAAPSAK
jgi:hypothetical protein